MVDLWKEDNNACFSVFLAFICVSLYRSVFLVQELSVLVVRLFSVSLNVVGGRKSHRVLLSFHVFSGPPSLV